MSYCRWSSDNFKCDLYCYEDSSGGWTTHVARSRTVDDAPMVPEITGTMTDDDLAAWLVLHEAQMAWLTEAERRPIGGLYDGESYNDPTIEEFRTRLTDLRAAGYRIPDYVFDTIDAEIAEEEKL